MNEWLAAGLAILTFLGLLFGFALIAVWLIENAGKRDPICDTKAERKEDRQ